MEEKQSSCGSICDRLPILSAKCPWLVSQSLEAEQDKTHTGDQFFYTLHDPLSHYRCCLPQLLKRRIRGFSHGWVILCSHPDEVMWSLWNPLTRKTICLPPLILRDGDSVSMRQCCVPSPPGDPGSVLLLTRLNKRTIVFCRLDRKRKRLRWTELTYAKQLKTITGGDNPFLHCLTCCNGKLYALSSGRVIQVDFVFKDRELVISLLRLGDLPFPYLNKCSSIRHFLIGSCAELFYIKVGSDSLAKKTLDAVYLFKLDMANMIWQEMEDLKNAIFFVNLAHCCSVFYSRSIAPELGGYIHILGNTGKVIYSYDIKDKTISPSRLPCLVPTSHVSLWECRLQGDHDEIKCRAYFKPEEDKEDEMVVRSVRHDDGDINSTRNDESHILNVPFDVLKMIMEFCVGVEYLNFRATCKYCQLAAPMIRWSDKRELRRRLHTYSVISPWLMVFDKSRGIITFTDLMFDEKYFIKTPQELIGDLRIYCSKYGWLLLKKVYEPWELFFYNPFTNDIRQLPKALGLDSICFSAPPTSPDCMVVGFSASLRWNVLVHFVTREQSWHMVRLDFIGAVPHFFGFPTFNGGRDIYVLNGGELDLFKEEEEGSYSWEGAVAKPPRGCSPLYFLVKCDQHLLLVVMDEFGEFVEVFKMNLSIKEWEKIDSLGRHMIYICGSMCVCMEAKTPEMENKIYFPQFLHDNGKILFYSLETCMYHTFHGRDIDEGFRDLFGTKYRFYPHVWIEPSWS